MDARTKAGSGRRGARLLLGLGLALVAGCAGPGGPRVARPDAAPAALWIQDVAVLDVVSGRRTPHRDVCIEEGRIARITPTGSAAAPAHARVLPGSGATLVPGLIDAHGHLYANPAPRWVGGLPDPDANLLAFLYAGVTTVFDPSDASGDAVARRDRVARGEQLGPHLYVTGPAHTAEEGHPIAVVRVFAPRWIGWWLAPRMAVALDSVEAARAAAEARAEEGVDLVKLVIDDIPLDAPILRREIAAALVARARELGLRTVAHIGSTQDALDAAEAGVDAWVHGVYIERIPEEQLARLAGYGIPMVATLEVFENYARLGGPREPTALEREMAPAELLDAFHPVPEGLSTGSPLTPWLDANRAASEARFENVRRLRAAGVTILAGSDTQSGVFPGAGLHRELAQLERAGLTPLEAIRAATVDAARFLAASEAPEFGNAAVGQRADLILVEGDPTADLSALSRIRTVILAGVPLERAPLAAAE